jgi:hypothetical protein
MRSGVPAPGVLAVCCTAMYIVGFFIAMPILMLIVVASAQQADFPAQQADFPVSGIAVVVLGVVAKVTFEAWRRMP